MASTAPQLFKAIQGEDIHGVRRILSFNPSLAHAKHRDGHSPLHAAAAMGSLPLVRELLQAGASCQDIDSNMEVPLHVACRQRGAAPVVRELLADAGRRSCLKCVNKSGASPLHLAVQAGQLEVVQMLINAGARVDARDRAGCTPMDYVDPRLPGLSQILRAGRQLTPSRPPGPTRSAAAAAAGSSSINGKSASAPHSPAPSALQHYSTISSTTPPRHPGGATGGITAGHTLQRRAATAGSLMDGQTIHTDTHHHHHQNHHLHHPNHHQWLLSGSLRQGGGCHGADGDDDGDGSPAGRQIYSSPSSTADLHRLRAHHNHQPGSAAAAAAAAAGGEHTYSCSYGVHSAPWGANAGGVMHPEASEGAYAGGPGSTFPPCSLLPPEPSSDGAADAHTAAYGGAHGHAEEGGVRLNVPKQQKRQEWMMMQEEDRMWAEDSQRLLPSGIDPTAAAAATSGAAGPDLGCGDGHAGVVGAASGVVQHHQQLQQLLQDAQELASKQSAQHMLAAYVPAEAATVAAYAPAEAAATAAAEGPDIQGRMMQQQQQSSQAAYTYSSNHMVSEPALGGGAWQQQQQQLHQHGPLTQGQAHLRSSAASLQSAVAAGASAAAAAAAGVGVGSLGLHYQQQHSQQQHSHLPQPPPAAAASQPGSNSSTYQEGGVPMGPLRSARAARIGGTSMATLAPPHDLAARSVDPLASSVSCSALHNKSSSSQVREGGFSHAHAAAAATDPRSSSARRHSSTGGLARANSWIVTPEASSGLLGGGPPVGSGGNSRAASYGGLAAAAAGNTAGRVPGQSSNGTAGSNTAAAYATVYDGSSIAQVLGAGAENPHTLTSSSAVLVPEFSREPAHGGSSSGMPVDWSSSAMPSEASQQQLHHPQPQPQSQQQQQQFAGLAAAVAASSSSGPLQGPLLSQISELSGKVSRLEAWFEAQVELIPDWQRALEVVQAVKRQADDADHLLKEVDGRLVTQLGALMDLAAKVAALEEDSSRTTQGLSSHDNQLAELSSSQATLKGHLAGFGELLQQLQEQLVRQAAAEGARTSGQGSSPQLTCLTSKLDDTSSRLDAATARIVALEAATAETKQHLQQQQEAIAAAATAPTTAEVNSGSSSSSQQSALTDSLTKQLAELKLQYSSLSSAVLSLSSANRVTAAPATQRSNNRQHQGKGPNPTSSTIGAAAATAAATVASGSAEQLPGATGGSGTLGALVLRHADSTTASQLEEFYSTTEALSSHCQSEPADPADHDGCSSLQLQQQLGRGEAEAAEEEDSWLPFMESTSACLATHEQQIEQLQALVPKLEGMVAQRAQLINLGEQVAALQTAFSHMVHGSRGGPTQHHASGPGGPSASTPLVVPCGPLGSHKAAADQLNLATSMVKLQGQMGQLTQAVEGLRGEWEAAAEGLRGEREELRRVWESERARISAAEGEAAHLMAEQQAAFAEREQRLMHIRATADEAEQGARLAALEAQQRLTAQLTGLQAQQVALAEQLAAVVAQNQDLKAQLADMQGQMAASSCKPPQQMNSVGVQASSMALAAVAAAAGFHTALAERPAPVAECSWDIISAASHSIAPTPRDGAAAAETPAETPAGAAAAAEEGEEAMLVDMTGAEQAAAAAVADAANTTAAAAAELAVLVQQKLVTKSSFRPSYWSSEAGGDRPVEHPADEFDALAGPEEAATAAEAALALDATPTTFINAVASKAGLPSTVAAPVAAADSGRRITQDAAAAAGSDRSSGHVQSMKAQLLAVASGRAAGRQGPYRVQHEDAAARAAQGPLTAAAALNTYKKSSGWLSKVLLTHHSSSNDHKAGSSSAGGSNISMVHSSKQHQLSAEPVQPAAKRSAAGALFGRWSKQARRGKSQEAPAAAQASVPHRLTDPWPAMARPMDHSTCGSAAATGITVAAAAGGGSLMRDADQGLGDAGANLDQCLAVGPEAAPAAFAAAGPAVSGGPAARARKAGGRWLLKHLGNRRSVKP